MADKKVPLLASVLGYAGLIPFVAGAVLLWTTPAVHHGYLRAVLQSYAAIILAFMGAIHWGLAMRDEKLVSRTQLGLSVLPALSGWLALAWLPVQQIYLVLIIAFIILAMADVRATRLGLTPQWYPKLRMPLTTIVVIALSAAAAVGYI
jgi:hypothetical protein